jgi:transmembrane sensor
LLSGKGKPSGRRNNGMKPIKRNRKKLNQKDFITENFSDREWEAFHSGEELSADKSDEMHRYILNRINTLSQNRNERKLRTVKLVRYLSAASVTILIGTLLFFGLRNNPDAATQKAVVTGNVQQLKKSESIWKVVSNEGSTIKRLMLPDSSQISIYPHSTIRYERLFDQKFRNVYLRGKAKFKVKKNTQRPFSVFSGALKTTALGTSFTISTKGRNISVKLHTGKIVVANVKSKETLAYISDTGATLLYDPLLATARVLDPIKTITSARESLVKNGNMIVMKNIPLDKVFRLLNEAYSIKITSEDNSINKIAFTGSVDTLRDKSEDILSMICLINNITLTKVSEKEFIIKKTNNNTKQNPHKL